VLDFLGAVLRADDDRDRPARELADLARGVAVDRQELAARVDPHEAEKMLHQRRGIRRAGARQRAAERVEVEAWRDARRAPVAVGAAEPDDRRIESVDEHVGRSDDEVVLAELSAELPGPD